MSDRFWSKVQRTEKCWAWMAGKSAAGYGLFWQDGTMRYAHRLSYEMANGPIPAGLQLDHLCRNRACVNPGHLQPVTQRDNLLRGAGLSAIAARKTHCIRGHEFSAANTRLREGKWRECRACGRERNKEGRHATRV